MGLKILHSADWHLDSPFTGFTESQRQYLKEQQRQIPKKIADLCHREDCDMMLLSGDLFDGMPSRLTLEMVKEALADSGVPVLIAPGNHDFVSPGCCWLEENWPENVFIFTGALESVTIAGLGCRIYGAAFQSRDCPPLLEDFQAEGEETYCVAVLHGDPAQKNSPYNPVTTAQVRTSGLDYLALGHVHKAGFFRAGNTLCAWPGCPMGRGWDETGEKGVCIVTIDEQTHIQAISLDTPQFHDLTVDVGENALEAVENALPGQGNEDFYRLTLTGRAEVDMEKIQLRCAVFPNLELRDRTQPPLDVWAEADADSLEGVYFGMLRKAMAEDPDNAQRICLAAEISRKLLDGEEVAL